MNYMLKCEKAIHRIVIVISQPTESYRRVSVIISNSELQLLWLIREIFKKTRLNSSDDSKEGSRIPCQIFFFRPVFGKYFARAIKFSVMNEHSQAMNSIAHPSLTYKMAGI